MHLVKHLLGCNTKLPQLGLELLETDIHRIAALPHAAQFQNQKIPLLACLRLLRVK